jgi:hypothetical protein
MTKANRRVQGALITGECALKSILDSSFIYTHSSATDVRKTFARVRLEQQQKAHIGPEEEQAAVPDAAQATELLVRRQPVS